MENTTNTVTHKAKGLKYLSKIIKDIKGLINILLILLLG